MKRLLYILSFILMVSTAAEAQPQKADSLLSVIEAATQQLRAELEAADVPLVDLRAEFISQNIIEVTWNPELSGKIDIQYYAPGLHREWQHSIAFYQDSVAVSSGRAMIGVGVQAEWLLRASGRDWQSHEISVKPWNNEQEPAEPPQINRELFTAFWSSSDVPENEFKALMSAGITRSPNYKDLERVTDTGRKVIPLFGGFDPAHSDQELRQRVGWYKGVFERIGWENIECIILRDEPYLKGLSLGQMEVIIDEAKKQYQAPVVMTFTQGTIQKRPLPQGLDIVIINFYPFFQSAAPEGYSQILDYPAFKDELDTSLNLIREKSPGSSIAITVQVFGSEPGARIPWRIPEPETADWYMRAIADQEDVIGLTFWEWNPARHIGLVELPELQQAWIDVLQN